MSVFRTAAVVIVTLLGWSSAHAQDWVGVWAADPAWCANSGEIGVSETAPVRITATELEGLETHCDISSVAPVGVAKSWRFDQVCSAEGYIYRYSEVLMLDHVGMLHRLGEEGILTTLHRCEGQ